MSAARTPLLDVEWEGKRTQTSRGLCRVSVAFSENQGEAYTHISTKRTQNVGVEQKHKQFVGGHGPKRIPNV